MASERKRGGWWFGAGIIVAIGCSDAHVANDVRPAEIIDQARSEAVPLVLRVSGADEGEGSKYIWQRTVVEKVLKNTTDFKFSEGATIEVAHLSWNPGLPNHTCTAYLVPYSTTRPGLWKLLAGRSEERKAK